MRLTVRPRALLIAFAVLVLLDVALRVVGPPSPPRGYRIPDRTTAGYESYVAALKAEQPARVAVVGDSVVYGTFALPPDTLCAQLTDVFAEKGIDARAHNFGLSGAHATDYLPLVADLATEGAADVIVINFDYRFFDASESLTRRYPELYDRALEGLPESTVLAREPLMRPSEEATRTFDEVASDAVGRVWALYDMREYLASVLLGDPPKRSAELASASWRARLAGRELYTKRSTAQLDATEVREAFDVAPFTADNPHLARLALALDVATATKTPVFVFAGPVDSKLLDEQGWWDRAAYEANLAIVRALVTRHHGVWLDYTDALEPEQLADTHHPLASGYRTLAEKLGDDIAPAVRRAVAARTGGEGER